ncbi:MAG TPA: alpha/beta hydrolase-fold protein [Steroidobacteraceae bacterium]
MSVAALSGGQSSAHSAAPMLDAMAATTVPATLEGTRQFDFKSTVNGHAYRVKVFVPRTAAPPLGFPVIYVLDGDAFFGTFAEAVRQRAAVRELQPAVVVGITYPREDTALLRRMYDLSPTQLADDEKAAVKELPADAEFAGADVFYEVIHREIMPRIAQEAHVDAGKSTLFGWSLGGLYVLHILFTHPDAFQTYIALSPSIWWNHQGILAEAPGFERRVKSGEVAPRIFIGVGAFEQSVPRGTLPPGFNRAAVAAELRKARMVDNVKKLATRLGTLKNAQGYRIQSRVFEDRTHNSVPWAAIGPVLEFAIAQRSTF